MTAKKTKGRPSTKGQPSKSAKPRPSGKRTTKDTPGYNTLQYGNALRNKRLKKWGITPSQFKKAGGKLVKPAEVERRTGHRYWALEFVYYDLKQKPTRYYRLRFLEEVKGPFGSTLTKPLRYMGPPGEPPHFYLLSFIDLAALANDVSEPIMITEGEACAIAAGLKRLACIAVPGVWAWRSKKHNLPAIKDFDLFKWKGRTVILCFDNDVMSNPQVIVALNALAHELTMRGAVIVIKFLPKGRGKIDLNDYFKTHSAEQFMKLRQESYAESKELWKLNEELAMVIAPNAAWEFAARRFLKSHQDFKNRFGDRIIKVKKADDSGFKEVSAIDLWQKWREKRRYKDIVYRPGADEIVDDCINTWSGYACEPKKGSVKEFMRLVEFVLKDEPQLIQHFLQWLAFPIQNPGEKNFTAYVLHSTYQGVGKSLLGYSVGKFYGDNFVVVDSEVMKGNFNGWVVNVQFALCEEITGNRVRGSVDLIKNMITRTQIHVNKKYEPEYDIEDCANFLLASNHVDPVFVEDSDRRFVVVETKGPPKEQEFYRRIGRWLENGGESHLLHYLLYDVDLSNYDPKAHAPMSAAKKRMIDISKSDLDLAVMQIRDNPDDILRGTNIINECPLLTATQLKSFINSYTDGNSTLIAVSKALRRGDFRMEKIDTIDGSQKLWAVRDCGHLDRLDRSQWANVYNKFQPQKKF